MYWRDDAIEPVLVPDLHHRSESRDDLVTVFVADLMVERPAVLSDLLRDFPELVYRLRPRATQNAGIRAVAHHGLDDPGSKASEPPCIMFR